jgi:hypothetical protein
MPNMDLMTGNNQRVGLASAKVQQEKKPAKATTFGKSTAASEFTLPPIFRPLLEETRKTGGHNAAGKQPESGVISQKSISTTKKDKQQSLLKNKEANFLETMERFPETKPMINMRLRDGSYKDPHD